LNSHILKSICSLSQLLFFWFQKCMVVMGFSKKIICLRVFEGIYQSWNSNIWNHIVKCHSYCSSGSKKIVLLGTKVIGLRKFLAIYPIHCSWNSILIQLFHITIFCSCFRDACMVAMYFSTHNKNRKFENLPGYLPKFELIYFDIVWIEKYSPQITWA
jgi:hypothetical protein